MRTASIILALALSGAAHAQVFKCEQDGRTVYSQDPCGNRAKVIDTTPAAGAYDPDAAARRRVENSRIIRQQSAEERQRDRDRALAQRQRAASEAAERRKCDEIRRSKQRAEHWSQEFKSAANVRREQDKAKQAESELWWECREVD